MTESENENDHFDLDHFDHLKKYVAKICRFGDLFLFLPRIINMREERNHE
jgi:hypothetical protein